MATAQHLAKRVDEARQAFLRQANLFSERTSKWKSSPDSWCATEIIEHLFWAKQGGVLEVIVCAQSAEFLLPKKIFLLSFEQTSATACKYPFTTNSSTFVMPSSFGNRFMQTF
jgi:hypothetical protein